MSFLGTLSKLLRRQPLREKQTVQPDYGQLRATAVHYDSLVNEHNQPYWKRASGADANQTATPEVRTALRNQARLEISNASYAEGIIETLANDTIMTGPRVQIIPLGDSIEDEPSESRVRAANQLEKLWEEWAEEVHLAESMKTSKRAKTSDGECFGIMQTDMRLEHPVKLTWMPYEADFFQQPPNLNLYATDVRYPPYDGIVFDSWGNPAFYWKLKHHPGSLYPGVLSTADFELVSARYVTHLFKRSRPGQLRGVCEIQPVLNLFKDLRDYAQSALLAADRAARLSAVISSDMPPGEADEIEGGPCQKIEIPIDAMMNLPDGFKATQLKAEQPVETFREFVNTIIREIARCVQMPFNIAAGDSGEMNYASARLDMQTYRRSVDVERKYYVRRCLEPLWTEWYQELQFAQAAPRVGRFVKVWIWDGWPHVDPQKEAQAVATLFDRGLLNVPRYWQETEGIPLDQAQVMWKRLIARAMEDGTALPNNVITFEAQAAAQGEDTSMQEPEDVEEE